MTILSAQSIRRIRPLEPVHERAESHGMTYGLSPAGYDVRLEFDPDGTISGKWIGVGTEGFLLCSTIERFKMPNFLTGVVHDKSSWARRGLTVQNTIIEPGWEGFLTLELVNHSAQAIHLKRGMPIAQVVFHVLDEPTEEAYMGKYQDQERGPQDAR